jgi:cytosine/adenosine deaminase-related metal-dependent hydrolase
MTTTRMRGIEASWLWSGRVEDAPIARGALVVDEAGTLVAVGGASELRASYPAARWEAHEGVLLPGLVNARTSLELSALRGHVPGGRGFVPWLDALTTARERLDPELDAEAIDAAVSELIRTGTAAVGDVSRTLASLEPLASAPLVAHVFHEIAGLRRETATVVRAMAEQQQESVAVPSNVELALAPHSLVGLHPDALAALFDGADVVPLPLAWTAAERAFLMDGGGPLAAWLKERGAHADGAPPGCDAIAYAQKLGVLGPALLATHLTDARPSELAVLAASGARLALCPRASLHVELKLPPLLELHALNARPGLGTDSLAAAPSLDVLDDAVALHRRFPTIAPAFLLAMATSFGAAALGLEHRVGALAPGLAPGVLLIEGQGIVDPLRHVLAQPARRVLVRPGSRLR